MNALELVIWGSLTLILIKLEDKPIYEHLQDLKTKINLYIGTYNINNWEELTEE